MMGFMKDFIKLKSRVTDQEGELIKANEKVRQLKTDLLEKNDKIHSLTEKVRELQSSIDKNPNSYHGFEVKKMKPNVGYC